VNPGDPRKKPIEFVFKTLSQIVVLAHFVMHEYRSFDISGDKH